MQRLKRGGEMSHPLLVCFVVEVLIFCFFDFDLNFHFDLGFGIEEKVSHLLLVCSVVEVWYEHLQVLISAKAFLFLQINPHKIQLQLSWSESSHYGSVSI